MDITTRFAPSPTGLIHLGNARTALFNALFAYHHQGTFLLRIEDTDQERSTPDYALQLMDDLQWLGLAWQKGPTLGKAEGEYFQSQRQTIYDQYYQKLETEGLAYPCFCSPQELALSRKLQRASGQAPRYAGTCAHLSASEIETKLAQGLKPTLRFRVQRDQFIEFQDIVRGQQRFASNDIGDFIIRRADNTPAFFFCNAIDDALMGVTHVFRGEDHLTNTPRQQLILNAVNLPVPQYGHISMIIGDDGTPLSKRNGSHSIEELRKTGWLAEGVVNYLARLGHTYLEDAGFQSLTDLATHFSVNRLGKAPARFDMQQLKHWQQQAVTHLDNERLWAWMQPEIHTAIPENQQEAFITGVRANVTAPQDAEQWAKILFTDEMNLTNDAQHVIQTAGNEFFQQAVTALEDTQGNYSDLVKQLKHTSGKKGKALFMPLRAALTGETHGPEMANLLPLMGLERAKQRLQKWI